VKGFLRLYPRSWRKRYGAEMEDLVDQTPGGPWVALDLVIGAAVAYRDVIRGNRILSAAGACLHGMSVAVLVQAIGFVTLLLVAQGRAGPTVLAVGPFELATVVRTTYFQLGPEFRALGLEHPYSGWLSDLVVIALLVLALAVVIATPRLVAKVR